MTTGIRQATVAVFDETEDKVIVMTIKAIISRLSSVPDFFTTSTPIFCARPVWNIAAPMTNMPANRTTVEFDRPANTSAGVSTPRKPRAIAAPIAVTASGMISVAKKKAAMPSTTKVNVAASSSISYQLLFWDVILNSYILLSFLNISCNFWDSPPMKYPHGIIAEKNQII